VAQTRLVVCLKLPGDLGILHEGLQVCPHGLKTSIPPAKAQEVLDLRDGFPLQASEGTQGLGPHLAVGCAAEGRPHVCQQHPVSVEVHGDRQRHMRGIPRG
jgi:hypothetical protein